MVEFRPHNIIGAEAKFRVGCAAGALRPNSPPWVLPTARAPLVAGALRARAVGAARPARRPAQPPALQPITTTAMATAMPCHIIMRRQNKCIIVRQSESQNYTHRYASHPCMHAQRQRTTVAAAAAAAATEAATISMTNILTNDYMTCMQCTIHHACEGEGTQKHSRIFGALPSLHLFFLLRRRRRRKMWSILRMRVPH